MNLTEKPETIDWPVTHYVYVEKIGPFQETAQKAWEMLHQNTEAIAKTNQINGFMSLYKVQPQMLYRAGVVVDAKPEALPPGMGYLKFEGGKYARFTLVGPYSQLPEACGKVFETVEKTQMPVREGFFIENYTNDPKVTPEDKLITEILIPIE